jgi:hypothetical protein
MVVLPISNLQITTSITATGNVSMTGVVITDISIIKGIDSTQPKSSCICLPQSLRNSARAEKLGWHRISRLVGA